jgi:hypothetical protein
LICIRTRIGWGIKVRIARGDNSIVGEPAGTPSKDGAIVGQARTQQTRSSRLSFAAEVRATELDSGREIWGETANLSKGGCYVRTREPFCQGTLLVIEIRNHGVHFLTDARVAYTLESTGMGLSFVNVPANDLPILEHWLSSAGRERQIEASRGATE